MLEDLNTIDIVTHEPGQWVTFAIIDSGQTKTYNRARHLALLNHKIEVCLAFIQDEDKFAELGCPKDVTVEVRCAYPVKNATPVHRSVTFENGRVLDYKIVFVHRASPYNTGPK